MLGGNFLVSSKGDDNGVFGFFQIENYYKEAFSSDCCRSVCHLQHGSYRATQSTGFHISPGIQYVMNPGGDPNATKLFIYGIRFQTFF